jgi:Domain of unknown function (DUF4902)
MFNTYVRLSIDDLRALKQQHIYSEIEKAWPAKDTEHAKLQGFTEWSAAAQRALSFGWEWTYECEAALMRGDWSSLRTNLMVVDGLGQEIGIEYTRYFIEQMMILARWEQVVTDQLGLPLRPPTT